MPIYHWLDKKSNKHKHVNRDHTDYRVPPSIEEAQTKSDLASDDEIFTSEEFAVAEWEKLISSGIRVTKGANWNYSKGNP